MIGHYVAGALRNARRAPVSTAIKLLALTLGLVCFLGAHLFGDYVRSADRRWANTGRIFAIVQSMDRPGEPAPVDMPATSAALAKYLRADFPELEAVARTAPQGALKARANGREDSLSPRVADPEILTIFDLPFTAGDPRGALDRPGSALISEGAARRLFGDVSPLGEPVVLQGEVEVVVTGVVGAVPGPSVMGEPQRGDWDLMITPSTLDDLMALQFANLSGAENIRFSELEMWSAPSFYTYVLLPDDGAITASDLDRRLPDFVARRVPEGEGAIYFRAEPVWAAMRAQLNRAFLGGPADIPLVGTLYGFGILVLAVACLNFANLSTAQAVGRSQEIGLRKALGAGRSQIGLQVLTETALLILAALALALAVIGAVLSSGAIQDLRLDMSSLLRPGFVAGVLGAVAGAALLAGAYPFLALARVRPMAAARAGSVGGAGVVARAAMSGLQFAAAAGLVVIVLIMLAQNAELRRAGLGLSEDPLVLVDTQTTSAGLDSELLRARLLGHPAVTGYTEAGFSPFRSGSIGGEDARLSDDATAPRMAIESRSVGYDFFSTVGARLVAGRDFSAARDAERTVARVILDLHAAERLGVNPESLVGETLYIDSTATRLTDDGPVSGRFTNPAEIVGVVDAIPFELRRSTTENYVYRLASGGNRPLVRISKDNVGAGVAHLEATLAELAPDAGLEPRFLDEQFEQAFTLFNRISAMLIALSVIAIAIAAMGLFGMASFVVRRRTREIGVRKALGAGAPRVLGLMLWDFSKPVLAANLVAWPLAWLAVQAYLDLFVTRANVTPAPFLAALCFTLLVAWLAVALQVSRAARVKPANVLKYE